MFSRYTIRFSRTIEGALVSAETNQEHTFRIDMNARGSDDPSKGYDVTGIISISDVADSRPFIGSLTRSELAIDFSDDELSKLRLKGTVQGRLAFGDASIRCGALYKADDDKPWGEVRHAQAGPSSILSVRIVRRSLRPEYKDRLKHLLERKPSPLPRRNTAIALAEAAFPAGDVLDAGGEDTIKRLEASVLTKIKAARRLFGFTFRGIERLFKISTGKKFTEATVEERRKWLERKRAAPTPFKRFLLSALLITYRPLIMIVTTALKFFHINTNEAHARLHTSKQYGVVPELIGDSEAPEETFAPDPTEPWEAQIVPSENFDADEVIEADVVVVGTGAGGGPVAKELAEKGFAVAILEAGQFFRREDNAFGSQEVTLTLGNAMIALPMGKAVGGTTFINAGTCFRTPPEVLQEWADQGMPGFHPDKMEPYFDRVEEIIKVAEAESKYVGPVGEVIRRGCEKLGYHSMNLSRNAFECEGKALCSIGCPHGAKQSTNRSYIPLALKSKASLFTGFKVNEILTGGERAIGVGAYGKGKNGKAIKLTIFAKAVILAAGALRTPILMQKNRLVRGNKWVGSNLSFHPAAGVQAVVPGVEMRTHECIPQGYCVDEFRKEGLMFEGANIPLAVWAIMQRGVGEKYIEILERYPNMASFGYMVQDTSRGKVRPGLFDMPLVTYWVNKADRDKLVRGMATLARIFFAAGAERAFGTTRGIYEMRSEEDVKKFEAKKWRARDFFLSAYHCLGTARVGPDPKNSAIDMNHQCHEVPGLFVVDGSAVPGSVGVNPQETIMAVASRAADRIAELLETASGRKNA